MLILTVAGLLLVSGPNPPSAAQQQRENAARAAAQAERVCNVYYPVRRNLPVLTRENPPPPCSPNYVWVACRANPPQR